MQKHARVISFDSVIATMEKAQTVPETTRQALLLMRAFDSYLAAHCKLDLLHKPPRSMHRSSACSPRWPSCRPTGRRRRWPG